MVDSLGGATGLLDFFTTRLFLSQVWPPPRMPVANKGLGWDSLFKMQ